MLRQKTTNAPNMVRCGKIVWRLLWSIGSYALKIFWVTRKHPLLHHMMRLVHRISQKCIRKITAKKGNLTSKRTWVSSHYLEKSRRESRKSSISPSRSIPHQKLDWMEHTLPWTMFVKSMAPPKRNQPWGNIVEHLPLKAWYKDLSVLGNWHKQNWSLEFLLFQLRPFWQLYLGCGPLPGFQLPPGFLWHVFWFGDSNRKASFAVCIMGRDHEGICVFLLNLNSEILLKMRNIWCFSCWLPLSDWDNVYSTLPL